MKELDNEFIHSLGAKFVKIEKPLKANIRGLEIELHDDLKNQLYVELRIRLMQKLKTI